MSESIGDFWIRKIEQFRKLLRAGSEAECPVCDRKMQLDSETLATDHKGDGVYPFAGQR